MSLTKEEYLKNQIEKLTQSWMSISAVFGAFLFLALAILDYFVTPENFPRFLIYRGTIALLLCILYFLNKLKR